MNLPKYILTMVGIVITGIIAVGNLFTHEVFTYQCNNFGLGISAFLVLGFLIGLFSRSCIKDWDVSDIQDGYISVVLVLFIIISALTGIIFSAPASVSWHNYEAALFSWGIFSILLGYVVKAFSEDQ